MKELKDKILEKVVGGAATYEELKTMVHTCPFCLQHSASGGVGDTYEGRGTAWMYCKNCGRQFEVYTDENAVYENATDVYTKRGVSKDGKLIEPAYFPDVQALWI